MVLKLIIFYPISGLMYFADNHVFLGKGSRITLITNALSTNKPRSKRENFDFEHTIASCYIKINRIEVRILSLQKKFLA